MDRRHKRPLETEDEKEMVLPAVALEMETLERRGEAMAALGLFVCVYWCVWCRDREIRWKKGRRRRGEVGWRR